MQCTPSSATCWKFESLCICLFTFTEHIHYDAWTVRRTSDGRSARPKSWPLLLPLEPAAQVSCSPIHSVACTLAYVPAMPQRNSLARNSAPLYNPHSRAVSSGKAARTANTPVCEREHSSTQSGWSSRTAAPLAAESAHPALSTGSSPQPQ